MILASHPALRGRTTGYSLPNPLGAAQKGMGQFEVLLELCPRAVCRILWCVWTAGYQLLIKVSPETNCWLKEGRVITI